MVGILKRHKVTVSLMVLAILCWWRLLLLKGIWSDDWAWVWLYFDTANLSEFMVPFRSLRHELVGYIYYFFIHLFDVFPQAAMNIWNVCKFVVFFANAALIYKISRITLYRDSILPETIAIMFLVSPVFNCIILGMLSYNIFLSLFLLAALFSVKSIENSRFNAAYYILAVLLSTVSMLGLESFVFFDISRAVIVFYIFYTKTKERFGRAIGRTIIYWVPSAIFGAIILLHRTGVFVPRSGNYGHDYNLYSMPIVKYAAKMVYLYAESIWYIFAGNIVYFFNKLSTLQDLTFFILPATAAAIFAVSIMPGKSKINKTASAAAPFINEAKFAAMFGLFLVIVGLFPYLMVSGDHGAAFGFNSRRALLANVGYAVILPSVLAYLCYRNLIRKAAYYILFGGFVFLGVFQCNADVQAYDRDWQQQRSFWWQFIWRVPDVKDKAYLLIDMPRENVDYLGPWNGTYEFSGPLNLLYARPEDLHATKKRFAESFENAFDPKVGWSYLIDRGKAEAKMPYFFNGIMKLYPRNLIIASYRDGRLYLNDDIKKPVSGIIGNIGPLLSDISYDQIIYKTDNTVYPLRSIIGPEPKNIDERTLAGKMAQMVIGDEIRKDWRYYLQAARVKDYQNDHDGVIKLYEEAERFKVIPELPEATPMFIIKSFYMTGKTDKANLLLWQWAISGEADAGQVKYLLDAARAAKNNPGLYEEVEKAVGNIRGAHESL